MNDKTPQEDKKKFLKKPLAIIGLIGVVIFIAWLAVQIVNVLPSAISSLASLADSVYNHDPKDKGELNLKADKDIVNSGDSFIASWDEKKNTDRTVFTYECKEGLSVEVKTKDKEFQNLNCEDSYEVENGNEIEIKVNSKKDRFSDLVYNINLYKQNDDTPLTQSQTIAIINPNINNLAGEGSDEDPSNEPDDQTPDDEGNDSGVATDQPSTPKTYIQPEYVYEIPVSDPNGKTDLNLSNLNVGVPAPNNTFIKGDAIIRNADGAIQFTVHNTGTKTSKDWTFSATLPGGVEYESKDQEPLKPNERSTITVEFPAVTENDLQEIEVSIQTKDDANQANNQLEKTVLVIQ